MASMPAKQQGVDVRGALAQRMARARECSDELFALLSPEALCERPIPERHRIIFYVGHLEAFDWNLLHETVFSLKSSYPEFDRLFAFGIDPVGGGLPADQPSDWPSVEFVRKYVNQVRSALDNEFSKRTAEDAAQIGVSSPSTLLNVAIEHRLMHVETLAYMFHQLPLERKFGRPEEVLRTSAPVEPRMIEVPAGVATLGLRRESQEFGWDNEYEAHSSQVPEFEIDQYQVTNQQFLEFIAAGGYETRSFWSDADWAWKNEQEIAHPVFWERADEQWLFRGMFARIPLPLPLSWPVYVSHAEAKAFANWKGKSLPTEAQWHRAAYGVLDGDDRYYPWGQANPTKEHGNFDLHRWDPAPVNAFPHGDSAFGVSGMLGNGWEWTSTVFSPFPGFDPFPFYRGYSADFFDGRHFVMKGGSARTAACMLRPTFRNWFQGHYQYVYAGFRCVSQ